MFNILFVCTGNTCRSPMAEGALKKLLENKKIENVTVASCGTGAATGFPATAYAEEAAKIWEADISEHESQPMTKILIEKADLVLALSNSHCKEALKMADTEINKVYLLKSYPEKGCQGDGVEDPIGMPLEAYNHTFLEIGEELGRILPHIIEAANTKKELQD